MVCSVSSSDEYDELQVVFWYKEGEETPLFIYDLRKNRNRVSNMRHVLEGARYQRFYFSDSKNFVALTVNNVSVEDEGFYRCRIDFRKSPTRITSFVLSVTVPPEKLTIRNNKGIEVATQVGAYNEGDNVTLFCEAIGGTPPPKLIWLQNGKTVIDDESNGTLVDLVNDVYIVRNLITFRHLRRKDAGTNATCLAKSQEMEAPLLATSVKIVLNLAPLNVSIQLPSRDKVLSANFFHDVTCSVIGSHPGVNITWFLGERLLTAVNESVSEDGNVTTSRLRLRPRIADDGSFLVCRGYNPALPNQTVTTTVPISVSYTPLAFVSLGLSLHPNEIKEGDDVYFECKVKAYPRASKLLWKHNGRQLHHNPASRVILSNQTLVLQHVDKMSAGNYTCHAVNSEGEGNSQPFSLVIKHRPYCICNDSVVYGLAIGETVNIGCRVLSSPSENLAYKWKFNNSHEVSAMPENRILINQTGSYILYRVLDEFDYGTVTCTARNEIGDIAEPCRFQIIPAGPPGAPKLCNTTKENVESLQIECVEGFDGGLTQVFVLEAYSENGNLVANMTGTQPHFQLKLLEPGHTYELNLWAANAKGRSDLVRILAVPPRLRESGRSVVYAAEPVMQVSPIIGSLIGGICGLLFLTVGVAISIHIRRRRSVERLEEIPESRSREEAEAKSRNSPDLLIRSNYRDEGECQHCPSGISFIGPGRINWSDPGAVTGDEVNKRELMTIYRLPQGITNVSNPVDPYLPNEGSFGGFIGPAKIQSSRSRISFSEREEISGQNESSV